MLCSYPICMYGHYHRFVETVRAIIWQTHFLTGKRDKMEHHVGCGECGSGSIRSGPC